MGNRSVLKNPTILTIGVAESVSAIGDWITIMAVLAMLIFRSEGGVAQSSGIILAGQVPILLVSPLAGWLCDRLDRKWLMIGSLLLSGLTISGLIFTTSIVLIYGLLALQAVFISIMLPARQAVVPDLVPRDDLTRANAFLQQLSGIVKVGAPVIAGFVLSLMQPRNAIILDVVSFVIAALVLLRLPALPPHRETKPHDPLSDKPAKGELQAGLLVMRQNVSLRTLFTSMFLVVFIIVGFDVLAPVFFRDLLNESERFFGVVVGLIGAGTISSSFVLLVRKKQVDPWHDLALGIILLSFIPLTLVIACYLPATGAHWIILAGCLAGGFGSGMVQVQAGTLLQLLSPAEMLGRIGGFFQSVQTTGILAGTVVAPLLVPWMVTQRDYFLSMFILMSVVVVFIVLTCKKILTGGGLKISSSGENQN